MPETPPTITVLMTVYNGAAYLPEAIASVLAQSFTDFEFLIIDDGSTDDSRECIRSYSDRRIRLIENERQLGQTASLNKGLAIASGQLIARQDQDDNSHPERLARQVEFLNTHTDCALVGSAVRIISETGEHIDDLPAISENIPLRWAMIFNCAFSHSSVTFRKGIIFDEFGGYDTGVVYSQDYDLWSRVATRHAVANLTDYLLDYRTFAQSASNKNLSQCYHEAARVIADNLGRFLQLVDIPEVWMTCAQSQHYYRQTKPVSADTLSAALDAMFGRFCDIHPDAEDDRDIRDHRAMLYWKIANLCPSDRSGSRRAWRQATALNPDLDTAQNRSRLWLLWLGGAEVRNVYRRVQARKTAIPSPS